MKRHLLLIGVIASALLSAQNNEILNEKFQKQNIENNKKFDAYVTKKFGDDKSLETQKRIESLRENLAGFVQDTPYFYETNDQNQIYNTNADALTTAGTVAGLSGSFNGDGIKYTVFDGGRIYAAHTSFSNTANRVTNREAATNNYSAHSTGVASILGGISAPLTATTSSGTTLSGNAKGVALNSTMDSYRFATTTLPGNTTTSTVFQKILVAQPKISNHSYGVNSGWTYGTTTDGYPYTGWYWGGNYINGNNYDLQGTYYTNDQNYDAIVYNNPTYTIVKSAGNYFGFGPGYSGTTTNAYYTSGSSYVAYTSGTAPVANCSQGFDCIGPGSLAKNIIVVGATEVITSNNYRYTTSSDVVKADYSSAGPRDDGGIKPDISATGNDVWMASTTENTTGSISWQVNSGTSMAAPQVAGIIGLWMQIYKSLFNNAELNAAASKTLMVHSASEAGNVGPDPWYGWGFINAKKGAELLVGKSNNTVIFNNETLTNAVTKVKTVTAKGTEPLKVTISWIDPEYDASSNLWSVLYNNRTSRLVNDIDLRIIDTTTNTTYYPWKLNATSPLTPATKGDNTVDNVEQVVIDNPVAGRTYRIEVSNKGYLVDNSGSVVDANYSILVTGYDSVLGTQDLGQKANELVIAPTMTKDYVKVLKAPTKSTYTVYDLSGKLLDKGDIKGNEHSLNLSTYANGVYVIEVNTGKDKVVKKVIKE